MEVQLFQPTAILTLLENMKSIYVRERNLNYVNCRNKALKLYIKLSKIL